MARKEELDALEQELPAEPTPEEIAAEAEGAPPPAEVPDITTDQLAAVLSPVCKGLGTLACRRAGVSGLRDDEADALGAALANLVDVYDLGPRDPKAAAWMGMGLTMAAIVAPRLEEKAAKIDGEGARHDDPS